MSATKHRNGLEVDNNCFREKTLFFGAFFRDPDVAELLKKVGVMAVPTARRVLALLMLVLQATVGSSGTDWEKPVPPPRVCRAAARQKDVCSQAREITEQRALESLRVHTFQAKIAMDLVAYGLQKLRDRKRHGKAKRPIPRRGRHDNTLRANTAGSPRGKVKRRVGRCRLQLKKG